MYNNMPLKEMRCNTLKININIITVLHSFIVLYCFMILYN